MSKNAVMPLSDYVVSCDKVREKLGTEDLIKSGELPEKINEVYEAGQASGQMQAEREMWDNLTANNTKKSTSLMFMDTSFEYIRPPYTLRPTTISSLSQTFQNAKKLKKVEADYFDFSRKESGSSGLYYTWCGCDSLEEIEDIGIQPDVMLRYTYAWCAKLKRIAKIRVNDFTLYDNVFLGCKSLEDVEFEGPIGQNRLNFQWSKKLNASSCHSIFSSLKDFRTVICENLSVNGSYVFIAEGTLNVGETYTLTFESDEFGTEVITGTVYDDIDILPLGENRRGVMFDGLKLYDNDEYDIDNEYAIVAPVAYIYQEGNKIHFAISPTRTNKKITVIKAPTETRTITMPKAVKDNGNATPEDIAEATERGWTIAWAE